MTNIDEQHDHNHLDYNLDRLLKLCEPVPRMPEDLKARIRSSLDEVGQESGKRNFFFGRWAIVSPLAATAVLALLLIIFWPGGTPGTISWADVQEKLDQIQTMTFKGRIEISTTRGKQIIERGKVYHKDPGFMRSEIYDPDTDLNTDEPEIESIRIAKSEPGLTELLTLYPGSHRAEWVTYIFRASGLETPARQFSDTASKNWTLMKQITANKTRRIGERVINGKPAVGFRYEGPAREIFDSSDVLGQVSGEIWVGSDDAVPLSGESEFQNALGLNVRMELWDIQWNVPLNESLFDLSVPEGWSLSRTRTESEYADTGLAPGVNLRIGIGSAGQGPLISNGDVTGVVRSEQVTQLDSKMPPTTQITIDLKPEAAQTLHDYADAHPNEIIIVDFNGQIKVAGRWDAANPTQLSFDLSLLDLSLSELEAKYFITSNKRNNQ